MEELPPDDYPLPPRARANLVVSLSAAPHCQPSEQLSRQTLTERDGDAGAPGSAVALTRQCYRSLRSASTERGRRACTSRTTAVAVSSAATTCLVT